MQVSTLAPADAAVFAIKECCGGGAGPFVEAEFVPIVFTDDGAEEDPGRERVLVTFSEEPGGLLLGHGARELEAGRWRFEGREENGGSATWSFEVDPELASPAPAAITLESGEPFAGSEYSVYSEGTTDVAYAAFNVDFTGPAFAVEVYEVADGERASEPLIANVSSYEVLQIGNTAPECQGRIDVPTEATYDVRVAAYSASGVLGEWSEFERIEVPALPSGGCAFSPRGGAAGLGWMLVLVSAACMAGRRLRRRAC